ncbi:TPA: hypothetical protein F3L22_08630 [Aeromonas hydrophila]|nr:hypothetical protein [Aeromonas hydrophila]
MRWNEWKNCEPVGKSGDLAVGDAHGGGVAGNARRGDEKSVHNRPIEKGMQTCSDFDVNI